MMHLSPSSYSFCPSVCTHVPTSMHDSNFICSLESLVLSVFHRHGWIYCSGPAQSTPLLLLHIIYCYSIITAICVTIIAAAAVVVVVIEPPAFVPVLKPNPQ